MRTHPDLTQHPVAATMPPRAEAKNDDLRLDMRTRGWDPSSVVTYMLDEDGNATNVCVDGWHRSCIAHEIDLNIPAENIRYCTEAEAVDVIKASENHRAEEWTPELRAAHTAAIIADRERLAKKRNEAARLAGNQTRHGQSPTSANPALVGAPDPAPGDAPGKAAANLAKDFGVSERQAADIVKISKERPDLFTQLKVNGGDLTTSAAMKMLETGATERPRRAPRPPRDDSSRRIYVQKHAPDLLGRLAENGGDLTVNAAYKLAKKRAEDDFESGNVVNLTRRQQKSAWRARSRTPTGMARNAIETDTQITPLESLTDLDDVDWASLTDLLPALNRAMQEFRKYKRNIDNATNSAKEA